MSELPKGWKTVPLSDLGRWTGGGTPSKSNPAYWVDNGIPWVSPKDMKRLFIDDAEDHITNAAVENSATNIVPEGSILVVTRSGILAHTLPVAKATKAVAINQDMKALIPKNGVDPDYILQALRAHEDRILRECGKAGTTVANLDTASLLKFVLPLPPLDEQRRIVAKLDSLFAHSRAARAELERIPRLIERAKQAVFAKAFSGELTQEWREQHPQALQPTFDRKGIDSRATDLGKIPDNWSWTSIGQITQVTGGLTKNSKRNDIANRVPYLRVANVYANELRLDDIAEIGCTASELVKTRLQTGDLLIVEGNGSIDQIGRVAIWDGEIDNCSHQNHLIRSRPTSSIVPKYALFWLLSIEGRSAIERVASSSAGLHTLSISKVEGLPIPVCDPIEQAEIVRSIEAAFARIDHMAAEAARAMALLDRLEQATLAKAFRGELLGAKRTELLAEEPALNGNGTTNDEVNEELAQVRMRLE